MNIKFCAILRVGINEVFYIDKFSEEGFNDTGHITHLIDSLHGSTEGDTIYVYNKTTYITFYGEFAYVVITDGMDEPKCVDILFTDLLSNDMTDICQCIYFLYRDEIYTSDAIAKSEKISHAFVKVSDSYQEDEVPIKIKKVESCTVS